MDDFSPTDVARMQSVRPIGRTRSLFIGLALALLITLVPYFPSAPAPTPAHAATTVATNTINATNGANANNPQLMDPATQILWQLGTNDNSAAEFSAYQKANPERVSVPGNWAKRTDWSFMSEGLDAADNPAMEINYELTGGSIPQYGVMFSVHILDAYESEPQMSVFSNGIMVGQIQITGMSGSGSTYPYEKLYRVYIPVQFLRLGHNVLRLEADNCIWCSSSENQYLWWKWDYLQLATLDAPATEPLNGSYINLGTTIVKNQFTYDQDTLRMAPYAMKWLGIAYSGNTIRSSFWTDTTSSWQPNATAWLQMLRDYNMQTVVDHVNGNLLGYPLNADGTLPQAVQTEYTNFFKTYGPLMQYYELDNEPGLSGMSLANEVAMAKWLHDNLPTLAPNVQLVAPGWSYWPTGGTPSGWERDPASRWQVEQYTALTNGHSYNTEEGGRGQSFLENLLTYGDQGLLTGNGLPKPMLTTEMGAYDYTTDDPLFGADPNHTNSAAWDRLLRGQIGYANSIDQFAAFSFNDLNMMQDNWSNDPFSTREWPAVANDDPRMDTYRRLALAYATHGAPLPYTYLNTDQVQNQSVYFRAVNTATLAPLPGSGGTSNKILLNFVNFNHEGTAPVTMNVQVQMPQASAYSGERFGAGTTYNQAHSYVNNLSTSSANNTITLSETLKPGEAVQYILSPQVPEVTPSAPTHFTVQSGNGEVGLNWWNASTPATSDVTYTVKRATSPLSTYTTIASGLTSTNYIDQSVTNGTAYTYVVTAVNEAGESPGSTTINANPSDHLQYAAGQAALSGGASLQRDSAATTGVVVGNLHLSGSTATFKNVDGGPTGGQKTLVFRFASANSSVTKGLIVNGQRVAQLTFPDTGSWGGSASAYSMLGVTVNLNPGFNNTIAITNDFSKGDQGGISLDYIELSNDQIDTTPPSAPGNLTVTSSTNTTAKLSWGAATDNVGVTQYLIESGGQVLAVTGASTTTATVTNLTPGTTYNFVVKARDAFSNLSADSNTASVITDATPVNLQALAGVTHVKLSWTGGTSNGITYNIKRATVKGGPYTTVATGITGTTYVDGNLTNGTTYYYVVSATTGSNESGNSNEAHTTPNATIVYPASSAETGGGAYIEGDGSVGGMDRCNSYVTFHNVDGGSGGTHVFRTAYASGQSNVSKNLYINGTFSQGISFQNTGGWSTYTTMNITATLNAGMNNDVQIKTDSCGGGVNIMSITLLS
ncbi:Fibronectin type III domain-containing protein [Ktedonobacteria bacterium brp13]|nr:Fibronectin type III domain-containing protein [Ktedonobacteria bacterium brp13]